MWHPSIVINFWSSDLIAKRQHAASMVLGTGGKPLLTVSPFCNHTHPPQVWWVLVPVATVRNFDLVYTPLPLAWFDLRISQGIHSRRGWGQYVRTAGEGWVVEEKLVLRECFLSLWPRHSCIWYVHLFSPLTKLWNLVTYSYMRNKCNDNIYFTDVWERLNVISYLKEYYKSK